jgi:hypothetical protein
MKHSLSAIIGGTLLSVGLLTSPLPILAQTVEGGAASSPVSEPRRPGFFHILGSIVFTTLHVPYKAVTCAATQTSAAVFYTTTFGVEGAYEGGTNGRDIGETATRSCTGPWIVRPSQVAKDYGDY